MDFHISKTANIDMHLTRGDSMFLNFVVKNNDGIAQDFSSYTYAKLSVRNYETDSLVTMYASSANTINISNRGAGQFIVSGSTEALSAEQYVYDFEIGKSNFKETVMAGKFIVRNDSTR